MWKTPSATVRDTHRDSSPLQSIGVFVSQENDVKHIINTFHDPSV